MTYPLLPFKRLLARNDGGVWGEEPTGLDDTVVLRSTEQTADGQWKINAPATRSLSPQDVLRFRLREDDLLVTKSSGSPSHIGKTTIVTQDVAALQACYSNFMQRLRVTHTTNARFYWYALRTREVRDQLDLFSTTSTGLANITAGTLSQLQIPCPPSEIQDRVVAYLDRETAQIDRLIAKQERLIELLAENRQAVITQAVTKGLAPSAPTEPSGVPWIGDVPAHWSTPQIGMHAKVGNGSTPNRDTPSYWSQGDIPWLNSSHVNRLEIRDADQFVTSAALSQCHLPLVQPGSLLVGLTGQGRTRGMTSILRFKATINQHIAYISPSTTFWSPDYLLWFMRSAYGQLREVSDENGSTKGALTCAALKQFRAPHPPLDEQAAIVNHISEQVQRISEIVQACTKAIDLLMERRSALISAAVTGKMDVREGAA